MASKMASQIKIGVQNPEWGAKSKKASKVGNGVKNIKNCATNKRLESEMQSCVQIDVRNTKLACKSKMASRIKIAFKITNGV
jgi:hypothetical protein